MVNKEIVLALMEAIRKKYNSTSLKLEEKELLSSFYASYFDDENFLTFKDTNFEGFLFDDYYNKVIKKCDFDFETMKKINIFRSLLMNMTKNVRLEDLMIDVYRDIVPADVLEKMIKSTSEKSKFLEDINGCFDEKKVANINIDNLNIHDLSSVKIEQGSYDNPLLFIKGFTPVPMIDVQAIPFSDKASVLVISDLHLDKDCYLDGKLQHDDFDKRLYSLKLFKEKIMKYLKKQKVKLDAVIFTGDVIDGLLTDGNFAFSRENRYQLIKEFRTWSEDLSFDEEATFTAYIAGNHDTVMGQGDLHELMKSFGDRVIDLGNGSARVKIGKDLISLQHPSADDWGIPGEDLRYTTRNANTHEVYHLAEYAKICQAVFDNLMSSEKRTITLPQIVALTNIRLHDENPELFDFYKPYITPMNGDVLTYPTSDEEYDPFFLNCLAYEPVAGIIKVDSSPKRYFQVLIKNPVIGSDVDNFKSQFTRDSFDRPVVSIVGHYHLKLINGEKRFVFSERDHELPIISLEGSMRPKNLYFTSTLYRFAMNDGHVDGVKVKPLSGEIIIKKSGEYKSSLYRSREIEYERPKEKRL